MTSIKTHLVLNIEPPGISLARYVVWQKEGVQDDSWDFSAWTNGNLGIRYQKFSLRLIKCKMTLRTSKWRWQGDNYLVTMLIYCFCYTKSKLTNIQVDKGTSTEDVFPEEILSLPKETTSNRARGSHFVRSSPVVRSHTFSPGARSQYVCRVSWHSFATTCLENCLPPFFVCVLCFFTLYVKRLMFS